MGIRLLEYLKMGTMTSIQDNGRILTIGLSPQWANLPINVQQKIYGTVVLLCSITASSLSVSRQPITLVIHTTHEIGGNS